MRFKQSVLLLSTLVVGVASQSNALPDIHPRTGTSEWQYITDVEGKRVRLVGLRFLPDPKRRLNFPGRDD